MVDGIEFFPRQYTIIMIFKSLQSERALQRPRKTKFGAICWQGPSLGCFMPTMLLRYTPSSFLFTIVLSTSLSYSFKVVQSTLVVNRRCRWMRKVKRFTWKRAEGEGPTLCCEWNNWFSGIERRKTSWWCSLSRIRKRGGGRRCITCKGVQNCVRNVVCNCALQCKVTYPQCQYTIFAFRQYNMGSQVSSIATPISARSTDHPSGDACLMVPTLSFLLSILFLFDTAMLRAMNRRFAASMPTADAL